MTLPTLSCSEVKIKSSVFPDLGNVLSDTHWVSPRVLNTSRNFSSAKDGCPPQGPLLFQVTEGRLKSPSRITSLSAQLCRRKFVNAWFWSEEFEGGLYTTYTYKPSLLSLRERQLASDVSTLSYLRPSLTYKHTPCLDESPESFLSNTKPGIATVALLTRGVKCDSVIRRTSAWKGFTKNSWSK